MTPRFIGSLAAVTVALGALTFGLSAAAGPGGRALTSRLAGSGVQAMPAGRGESHGIPSTFEARLVPERVERTDRGAAMTASLELTAEPSFHTMRWVVGVYRADGTAVDTQRSTNVAITDGAAEQSIDWPPLPDGYFVARATAVGTSGTEDASSVTELFLEVRDGEIDVLENNDWLTRSGAIDARPSLSASRPGHE